MIVSPSPTIVYEAEVSAFGSWFTAATWHGILGGGRRLSLKVNYA